MTENEKDKLRKYQKNKTSIFLCIIKMSEKRLKFNDVEVDNNEFHAFKQTITLNLLDIEKIVISDKFKHGDKGFKCFIDYKEYY